MGAAVVTQEDDEVGSLAEGNDDGWFKGKLTLKVDDEDDQHDESKAEKGAEV